MTSIQFVGLVIAVFGAVSVLISLAARQETIELIIRHFDKWDGQPTPEHHKNRLTVGLIGTVLLIAGAGILLVAR